MANHTMTAIHAQHQERGTQSESWPELTARRGARPPRGGLGFGDATPSEREVDRARALPPAGPAKVIPEGVRAKMEGALGVDLTGVRVHEGPRAAALGALAYTQGMDVHFAPGQYQPNSRRGQEILGHELVHVVQQAEGRVRATRQMKGVGLNDNLALEREADELALDALRGAGDVNGTRVPNDVGPSHDGVRGLRETGMPRLSPSPASPSAPVQRAVVTTVDASVGNGNPNITTNAAAQQLYDDALAYLWTSAAAREIYRVIHAHPTQVEVRVGHTGQTLTSWDGNNNRWLVEWNPYERIVAIDTDQRTLGLTAANPVAAGLQRRNVQGVLSSGLELLHEFGHVKQHMETLGFYNTFNPAVGPPVPAVGNLHQQLTQYFPTLLAPQTMMDDWLRDLHQAIQGAFAGRGLPANLVDTTVRGGNPPPNAPSPHADVIEPDNTTRHERPVARDKNEALRFNYHAALKPQNLPPNLQPLVALPAQRSPVDTPIVGIGGGVAQPVPDTIVTHLQHLRRIVQRTLQDVGANNIPNMPGWATIQAQQQAPVLVAYLTYAIQHWRNVIHGHAQNVAAVGAAAPARQPTFNSP